MSPMPSWYHHRLSQYCIILSLWRAGPVFQLQCGHVYHTDCLKKWFEQRASCPVCLKKFGKVVSWQNLASQVLHELPASDESQHFNRPSNSNTQVLQHWLLPSPVPTSFCFELIEALRSVDNMDLLLRGWDTAAHRDIPMAEGSQHPAAGKYQCHWRHCDSVTWLNSTPLNAMVLRSWLLLRRCFAGS